MPEIPTSKCVWILNNDKCFIGKIMVIELVMTSTSEVPAQNEITGFCEQIQKIKDVYVLSGTEI